MSDAFHVDAPGKVVLLGEYAVLDGAPAVVAAVNRGVRCTVGPADNVRIDVPEDDRYARAGLQNCPPAHYIFSDWNPVDLPSKPGLGGSAAATVAAVLAGVEAAGRSIDVHALRTRAAAVHHAVQGSGSGIDVAASAHGGLGRFQEGSWSALAPMTPVIVWSGTSARTGPRVLQYQRWSQRLRFVEQSTALVDAFESDPVGTLREATRLLESMTRDAGIDWWTGALQQITLLAARCGGAAKPSGAGGGDIAVALFPDSDAADAFRLRCNACGLPVIPAELAPGATVWR